MDQNNDLFCRVQTTTSCHCSHMHEGIMGLCVSGRKSLVESGVNAKLLHMDELNVALARQSRHFATSRPFSCTSTHCPNCLQRCLLQLGHADRACCIRLGMVKGRPFWPCVRVCTFMGRTCIFVKHERGSGIAGGAVLQPGNPHSTTLHCWTIPHGIE